MEAIGTFIGFFIFWMVVRLILSMLRSGTRAAYNKVTEPADSMKKYERDTRNFTKRAGISGTDDAKRLQDTEQISLVFARFAIAVSLADGHIDESEMSALTHFFDGAHPELRMKVIQAISRDGRNPSNIDWNHTVETGRRILASEDFYGFDYLFFDGLLSVAAADGRFDDNEILTIANLMEKVGWDEDKVKSAFESRFGRPHEQKEDSSTKRKDALQTLGLQPTAGEEEIKQQFRHLAKQNHPDISSSMGTQMEALAHERFSKIREAYEYLMSVDNSASKST